MKRLRSFSSVGLMLTLGATPLMAQQTQEPERVMIERERTPVGQGAIGGQDRATFERHVMMQGPPLAGDFVFLGTEMSLGGKLVKGAPYSAQSVMESTHVLSDGNRIVNKSMASVYRDSEGRTRREQTIKAIGAMARGGEPSQTIFIHDPVAGTSYSLDPKTLIARKLAPMRFKVQGDPGIKGGVVGYRDSVKRVELEPDHGEKQRIAIEGDAQLKRQIETGVGFGWLDKKNPTAKTEQLGKQNINGVEAEGTRTTVTIPPGEIGNELAIEIVSERWFSPELQVIVKTRHFDPRFGENTYQLIDINRSEPSRELFEVPAGYKIEEAPLHGPKGTAATNIKGGGLNGKAISLPTPEYPALARQAQASGAVTVQVTVDEEGNVVATEATSGHPLLRAAAVTAAQKAKFSPTRLNGQLVKVSGVL
ncbi:MAG TPA: TonB family protein, partial [Pyrinomonadaceae bacterium]|nr:TonB family protein [Pyrinomonadaceae bacterium]